jgi:TonB family protein
VVCGFVCATAFTASAQQPQDPPPAQQAPATSPPNQAAPPLTPISSPEIDALVARFVPEIKKLGLRSVAVFGAQGPGDNLTMLGYSIGDAVSESLSRQADGFRVIDRSALLEKIKSERVHESALLSPVLDGWISQLLKVDAILFVRMETLNAPNLTIALSLFNAKAKVQKAVAGDSSQITIDDKQIETAKHPAILESEANSAGHIPHASSDEVRRLPECISCPRPDMSNEARKENRGGDVWLEAIITREGKVERVWVIKAAGRGLDEKAVEAVRNWLFKPLKDANGTPIKFIATIQVQFQFFNGPSL